MSILWEKLIACQNEIIQIFNDNAEEFSEPGLAHFNKEDGSWVNRVWRNDYLRRCHIDVVDARATKGLWMMHVCCFPNINNDAPIYGFDVIAGKNKITGAFHDFSPTLDFDHDMILGYKESVEDFIPKKQRELPDWAKAIFSDKMLAAGNVKEDEATPIINIALDNLRAYFDEVKQFAGQGNSDEVAGAQNFYCEHQQMNPHTPNVMKSLGLEESDVETFCTTMLFPKI
jgi:phycocyanobilin:ferredoxin oxidoreductase